MTLYSLQLQCVYYYYFITMQVAVHGCSAMLLSLLQPPSSGSLSQFLRVCYNEVKDLTILLNHHIKLQHY